MRVNLLNTSAFVRPFYQEANEDGSSAADISAAGELRGRALGLAAELRNDKDEIGDNDEIQPSLEHMLERLADGRIDEQRSAFVILQKLVQVYGDKLDEFPEPDSEQGKTGNKPYDKGKVPVIVDGERKERNSNFYSEYFSATQLGKEIDIRIAQLAEAVKPTCDMNKLQLDKTVRAKDYPDWIARVVESVKSSDKRWLIAERKTWDQRKSAGRGYIKRAMKLRFAIARIEENFDDVGIDYASYEVNGETKLVRTNVPFILFDKNKRGTDTPLNVSQLIRLGDKDTISEAKASGGKFANLIATLRRERKDTGGDGKDAAGDLAITNTDRALGAFNSIRSYFGDDSDEAADHVAALMRRLDRKHRDSAQLVKLVGDTYHVLGEVFSQVRGRYEKMLAENAREEESKAA